MNIIGRLTKNAQIITLPSDKQVVNFSVAVNDSYRNKQGDGWNTPSISIVLTGFQQMWRRYYHQIVWRW